MTRSDQTTTHWTVLPLTVAMANVFFISGLWVCGNELIVGTAIAPRVDHTVNVGPVVFFINGYCGNGGLTAENLAAEFATRHQSTAIR